MIRVQQEPFDVGQELTRLKRGNTAIGGIALFVGTVRDHSDDAAVSSMALEHYPGMTEKALADIEAEARRRWPLEDSLIIHRYGHLQAGDDIVLVIAASAHREAAFSACEFLVDWLKTKAPFWKREAGPADTSAAGRWVAARAEDDDMALRWEHQGEGSRRD